MEFNDSLLKTSPAWIPDDDAHKCSLCDNSFNLLNRRHHCRGCGNVVCGNCSRHTARLPQYGLQSKEERICDVCNKTQGEIETTFHRASDLKQKLSEGQTKRRIFEENEKEALQRGVSIRLPTHKKDRKLVLDADGKALHIREEKSLTLIKSETKIKLSSITSILLKDATDIIINQNNSNETIILKKDDPRDAESLAISLQKALEYRISCKKQNVLLEEYNETRQKYEQLVHQQNPSAVTPENPLNYNQTTLGKSFIMGESIPMPDPDPPVFEKQKPKQEKDKKQKDKKEKKEKDSASLRDKDDKRDKDYFKPSWNKKKKDKQSPTIGAASEISRAASQMRENNEKLTRIGLKTNDLAANSKSFLEQCRQLNQ